MLINHLTIADKIDLSTNGVVITDAIKYVKGNDGSLNQSREETIT